MPEVRVLVPVDGSEATLRAVGNGIKHIATPARVTFLVVMDKKFLDMPKDAREHLEWDDEDEIFLREDEANAALDAAVAKAEGVKGLKVHREVVKGDPLEEILTAARDHDILIMHAMRRSERADKKQRSLTEALARQAECDVLLVHDPEFN